MLNIIIKRETKEKKNFTGHSWHWLSENFEFPQSQRKLLKRRNKQQ